MVGDRLRRAPAELKCQAYAAARRRRDLSCRVADEHHAVCCPRRDEPARGYAPRPALNDAGLRVAEERLGGVHERLEIRAATRPHREPHLGHERARRDPGEIAGRKARIQEAMKEARIRRRQSFVLGFETDKEPLVASRGRKCRATADRAPSAPKDEARGNVAAL